MHRQRTDYPLISVLATLSFFAPRSQLPPDEADTLLVKRLMATPGQTVEITNG